MTEYFVVEQDTLAEGVPVLDQLPEDIEIPDFIGGQRLNRSSDEPIEISLRQSSGDFRPDMITYLIPLFSTKIKQILDDFSIENIDYYPVRLHHQDRKIVESQYCLANIIGLIECVDLSKSDAVFHKILKKYKIKSFVIDETKVKNIKIFRIYEKRQLIIIDQDIKDEFEKLDLQGIRIRNTRDYDGY